MELNPLIKAGSAELNRLAKEAHGVGAVMDDKTVAALGRFDDTMQRIQAVTKTAGGNIAAAFLPALEKLAPIVENKIVPAIQKFAKFISDLIEKFDNMSPHTQKVVMGFVGLAVAIGPVMSTLGGLTTGISGVVGALGKAAKALSAGSGLIGILGALIGPAGLALAAIAALAAVIGTVVYITGRAGREIKQMTEDLIESYEKEAAAQKEAIDKASEARINALNERQAAETTASYDRLALIQTEYEKEIEGAGKKEQALKKNLQERMSALTDSHNEEIQRIRDEYGVFEEKNHSRTDLVNEQYDKEVAKATKAYNEKIALIDAEYAARLKLLDAETQEKVRQFQSQIEALNAQTAEENRILKEKRDNEKILDFEARIASEEDAGKKRELQKELQEFLAELTRQKILEGREIEKEAILQRIEEVKNAADKQKEVLESQAELLKKVVADSLEIEKLALASKRDEAIKLIQEERLAKEEAENKKYESAKAALDKEELALDGFADRYKERLDAEFKNKKALEEAKLKETKDRITEELTAEMVRIEALKKLIDEETKMKAAAAESLAKAEVSKNYISPLLPSKSTLRTYRLLPGLPTIGEMFPGFAGGVRNWRGGFARINERGGEIVNLPSGANVIPHDLSKEMLSDSKPSVQINITGNTIANDYDVDRLMERAVKRLRMEGLMA